MVKKLGFLFQRCSGKISLNENRNLFNNFLEKKGGKCVIYFFLFIHGHVRSLPVGYCCSPLQTLAAAPLAMLYACGHQRPLPYCSVSVTAPTWGHHTHCSRGPLCAPPSSVSLLTVSVLCAQCR